ncbi:MAG: hypothetical protein ACK48V_09990 [Crocinitomicaceae bacterium]|jgi:hypothetical protein
MKFLFYFYFSLLFICSSCSWDVETRPVFGNSALSDGNSKVWLVDHLFKNGLDFQQPEIYERDLIVFYSTNKCRILKWKDFAKSKGDIFYYQLIRGENKLPKLNLWKGKKKWAFNFTTFSNEKMVLEPIEGTNFKYTMSIIPLPEW